MDQTTNLAPGASYHARTALPTGLAEQSLLLRVLDAQGVEVIHYQPEPEWDGLMPDPYQAPDSPQAMESIEDLYLTGLHLEQYRHPALKPEVYWLEALRRDPEDSRSNLALGRQCLRQGEYLQAEAYFRAALKRLTKRNLNPPDGEAHYQLGLVLQYQGKYAEAYPLFSKAAWAYAWRSPAYTALAQLDCCKDDWASALEHAEAALQSNPLNHKGRNLKCAALRKLGQAQAAAEFAAETLRMDPLDHWARFEHALAVGSPSQLAELPRLMRSDVQTYLDIAFDYAAAGLWQEASDFLLPLASGDKIYPMVAYALGFFARQMGQAEQAAEWYRRGAAAAPDYCFPWRLEEMQVLRDVLANNPQDARAAYYLGNLLYDKKQFGEALELWQRTTQLEPGFAVPWRNLGLAAFNRRQDMDHALEYFAKAWSANPQDARILLEYDQLRRRKSISPADRLALMEAHLEVLNQRDDLIIERISLYNRLGQPEKALEIAAAHTFHAWEGGEGRVAGQYANAHWLLGRQALEAHQPAQALEHFQKGLEVPENLGVVPFVQETIHLEYFKGLAFAALDQAEAAKTAFELVAATPGWMHAAYYQALSLRQLGKETEAVEKLHSLSQEMAKLVESGPQFNYFFSGKPSPIFEDDLKIYNRHAYLTALGLARLGLGDLVGARSAFGQALSLNPANIFAHEELRRIQVA
jgi:tetratricopeptide (TPR) repeat protein